MFSLGSQVKAYTILNKDYLQLCESQRLMKRFHTESSDYYSNNFFYHPFKHLLIEKISVQTVFISHRKYQCSQCEL